jgi:hypothetical protein
MRSPSHRDNLTHGEASGDVLHLLDDGQSASDIATRAARKRLAEEANLTAPGGEKSRRDADERGFAGAVWTEDTDHLPCRNVEVDVLQLGAF